MRRTACIMRSKSFIEIAGNAYVALIWDCKTLDEIDVFHETVPLRTMVLRGTAFVRLASQPKL